MVGQLVSLFADCHCWMAVRTMRAPVSAFLICASLYLGSANTATPPATMAMIATTISTSTSVTPRRPRRAFRRASNFVDDSCASARLNCDDFVFMGSSSFYAIEPSGLAIRTVARELVSVSLAMSRTGEPKSVPPSIGGRFLEISIRRELVEAAWTTSVIVSAVRVDGAAHADQRGAGLPHARTVAFSHSQDGDEA